MKRIIMMVARLGPKAVYYFLRIWYYSIQKVKDYSKGFYWAKKATIAANKAGRVTIEAHGLENLPEEDGFILFPNHQGLYDVLAFLESCPRPFAFIIKKEASNVILLKQVMKALGSLAMDRDDIRQSLQVINTMAEEVKKGRNFLIFPEGTRSRQGNRLIEFKAGSFKSAVKAKCPIVPCAIIDAFVPFDENHTRPVTVKLYYLKPMYYEEYQGMKTVEIAEEVKKRIEKTIADEDRS
jgi:1-acyl-sn-glycerol-3-phosphate acyltransferase